MLEHSGLYERLTAEENLEYYGRINRMALAERQERMKELLTHFGLWERCTDRVGIWRRGIKQKLAISRALLYCVGISDHHEPWAEHNSKGSLST